MTGRAVLAFPIAQGVTEDHVALLAKELTATLVVVVPSPLTDQTLFILEGDSLPAWPGPGYEPMRFDSVARLQHWMTERLEREMQARLHLMTCDRQPHMHRSGLGG